MGTLQDAGSGALERSRIAGDSVGPVTQADLLEQVTALQAEVDALRAGAGERAALEESLGQLREANQNLVLAAVSAQTLRDDAEEANRRQNEFLAMLAHELRNPLAPIGMAAALLERVPNPPPQLRHFTQVIGRQVGHMACLLDDLLDAARISSGKITLLVEPLLLAEVIEQAIETVQPRIRERKQLLLAEIPATDMVVNGDRVRLTQVFTNLLGNASKYTGDGGQIRFAAAPAAGEILVTVEDNGSGIAPEVIPHIFDLFTQGPRSLARSEGGLGVGLNVVRSLVSMHSGTVHAASAGVGQGSRFTVRLPLSHAAIAPGASHREPAPDLCRRRVLLVEDNVDACETLQHLLSAEGHDVATAHDGGIGLAMALEQHYDVLICDIGLPGIDGYGLMQSVRASEHDGGGGAFAVALSGYCQAEDRQRALDAGFDHYFVKPASPEALLALVATGTRAAA